MVPSEKPQERTQTNPQQLAGRTYRMMRETHGLTLRALAEMVGVSHSHLLRVESGERAASADLDRRLTTVFAHLDAPEQEAS